MKLDLDACGQLLGRIEQQIASVIVGQRELVREAVICLMAEGHLLIEGVPGLGKTKLVTTLASTLDMQWRRIQFTPDLMPADIVGTQVLLSDASGSREVAFRPGPVFANLVLADEINRATPKTQSALLEAMQERHVTAGGETRPLPTPFLVLATQNPIEQEGTYPLPEAQLDRFLLKARVEMPDAQELVTIIDRTTGGEEHAAAVAASTQEVRALTALTREVPVPSHVLRHVADLVVATHPSAASPDLVNRYVRMGSSPRGAQALVLAAKASALMAGRPSVSIDDVRSVAHPALRHRLLLGFEAAVDGLDGDAVIDELLATVPVPDGQPS